MTDDFATIRGTNQKLDEMIRLAAAGYHAEIYVKVDGANDVVHTLAQTNGNQVMSYCSFRDLNEVSGEAEAILSTGIDSDTKGILDYLGIAEGSGTIEMTFSGEESDGDHPRLASYWEAEGALNTRVRLPASRDDLSKVPWQMPDRFTEDNQWVSTAAKENGSYPDDPDDDYLPPTAIVTTADTVNSSIIQPADFMDALTYYPITTEDGDLVLDLEGNEGDDRISGEVNSERVEGPDVDVPVEEGFKELFGVLSGPVRFETAPDENAPLVVVQDDRSGQDIRHVLGRFAEA